MKNVKFSCVFANPTCLTERTDPPPTVHPSECEALCFDPFKKNFYCATKIGIFDLDLKFPRYMCCWCVERNKHGGTLISFEFLSDDDELCAILGSGKCLLKSLNDETKEPTTIDIVPTDIDAACWAQDYHELVISSQNKLCFVSRRFEIIRELVIDTASKGIEELVTLGWGSKETQFQGFSARGQRKHIIEEENYTPVFGYDQKKTLFAWSGDTHYIAVSYVDRETNFRLFSVVDRDGELVSHLTPISGAQEALCYWPSANLIGAFRIQNNLCEVVFHENNGQRRTQFTINHHEGMVVKDLAFNPDGTLLSIRSKRGNSEFEEICFWHRSNYDWMQKYRLTEDHGFLYACWAKSNSKQYVYMTKRGVYVIAEFEFTYDFCDRIVVVVNGRSAKVTNMKIAPVPPPWCHYKLTFSSSILEVLLDRRCCAFLLDDGTIQTYELNEESILVKQKTLSIGDKDSLAYNLCYNKSGQLTWIALWPTGICYVVTDSCRCGPPVPNIVCWHGYLDNGLLVCTTNGEWLLIDSKNKSHECRELQAMGKGRSHIYLTENRKYLVALNNRSELYVNGREIFKPVISYTVSGDHLLFVTYQPKTSYVLHFCKIEDLMLKGCLSNIKGRTVEDGAMLIGREDNGTRVWLQMPRGNLETIHIRELIIDNLKSLLDNFDYKAALLMMRKHRIDMNLVYDHNPKVFMENILRFVSAVVSADLLNLFIGSLHDSDVTISLYSNCYGGCRSAVQQHNKNKVRTVCEGVRKTLLSLSEDKIVEFFTVIISTYIKVDPPEITEALLDIKKRTEEAENSEALKSEWISFLSILRPREDLFKCALSTYDVSLASVVAETVQMDPSEYYELLTEMYNYSPVEYRQYKIDMYLHLYEKALKNLAELDDFWDEAALLIERRGLYSLAVKFYRSKKLFPKVCALCAKDLKHRRLYEEAAILFTKADDLDEALDCYKHAQDWQGIASCATKLGWEKNKLHELLQSVLTQFENTGRYRDTVELLTFLDADKNAAAIVDNYCKVGAWDDALKIARKNPELLALLTKNSRRCCQEIIGNIKQWTKLLEQYKERLIVLRKLKEDKLNLLKDKDSDDDTPVSLMFSEAESTTTGMSSLSQSSKMSVRSRKNIDRKKRNLREGSSYEDAALLNAIKDTVHAAGEKRKEIAVLLKALLTVESIDEGRSLQCAYTELLDFISKVIAVAWPLYIYPQNIPGPLRELYTDDYGVVQLPVGSLMPPRIPSGPELTPPQINTSTSWKLDVFK